MPELIATMEAKQSEDYESKKFAAALKGVDLDKNNNAGQEKWEEIKARAFSKGKTTNSQDITTLQGQQAAQSGFGIGNGLDYEVVQ